VATLRVFVTISDPELRGFAELAIEFVRGVYRPEVLGELEGVFLTSADPRDLGESEKLAEEILGKTEHARAAEAYRLIRDKLVLGAYYQPKGRWRRRFAIAVLLRADHRSFCTLAHELAHHVTLPRMDELLKAFREDVPEIDELIEAVCERVAVLGAEEQAERLGDRAGEFVREYAADYVAVNYFLLLNTRPVMDEATAKKVWLVVEAGRVGDLFSHPRWLADALDDLLISVYEWRLPKDFTDRLADKVSAALTKVRGQPDLPRFRAAVHSVLEGAVLRWPKEVYMSDPEKYEPLFKDLDREALRRMRVPTLV